jgi:hypothetical protein
MTRKEMVLLSTGLVLLSAVAYALQFAAFDRPGDTLYYLMQDLAFLPLSVLFVTLVVDRLMAERDRNARQHKMNMVIGTFFAAVGEPMLRQMRRFVTNCEALAPALAVAPDWTAEDLARGGRLLATAEIETVADAEAMQCLKELLREQRDFMLRLLENPILLEHETFTDLLWAVFHIQDELAARETLEGLPESDLRHLAHDLKRGYGHLLRQWLAYLGYLRADYPFLFSLSARTNPLRPGARAEVV